MEPIRITHAASGSTATIAAHLGFNCFEFIARVGDATVSVVDSSPGFRAGDGRFSGNGIPLLFPFPNRIRSGTYSWGGRSYKLPSSRVGYDQTGNAIHGFCLDRPWRVTDRGEDFVVGEFQLSRDAADRLEFWPADCLIEVRYQLEGAALNALIRIANPDNKPLPWGFGTHPYFTLPLDHDSDPHRCLIQAPASEQWELIDCLPTKTRKSVAEDQDLRDGQYFGTTQLDDVLTGLEPDGDVLECVIIDEKAGLQIAQRCDPRFRELVVYNPPGRNAVCLEPYTCVTDAINLQQDGVDAGLRILEPGEEFRTWIQIEAGLVVV